MKNWITQFVLVTSLLCVSVAFGQVTISIETQPPVPQEYVENLDEFYASALENATRYDYMVTTPDDILVVDFSIDVTKGEVFNPDSRYGPLCPYGVPCGPFDTRQTTLPGILGGNPWMRADSWIATPGTGTACAQVAGVCPGFSEVPNEVVEHVSHFDSSNEGAQTDFNFARITMLPDMNGEYLAHFSGTIFVANQPLPIAHEFSFELRQVPEPDSRSLLFVCLGAVGLFRRCSRS